jgi:two-component system, cell cycle response regulator
MRTIIVDSSRTVLKIVGRLLEAAGHRAHLFIDGHEALQFLQSNPEVEALITSIELPTISGIDLCRLARKLSSVHRPIYIMVMSSSQERHKLVEALENGADDFVGKPPATEELIARLRAAERLSSMQRDLVRLAASDPLTGLLNRRAFFEKAEEAFGQTNADSRISALMFDIDRFKLVNDTYGHGIGDQVIRKVADAAAAESDLAGRLGGEEFVLLLRDTALADALACAERLRTAIAATKLHANGDTVSFTCSFGVDEWTLGETADELLRRADLALYQAKAGGRNRVVAFDPATAGEIRGKGTGTVRAAAR